MRDGKLLNAISSRAIHKIDAFSVQNLANIAWAYATLGWVDKPLSQAIARAASAKMPEFGAQELANTAWAFAKLGFEDAPLMSALAVSAMARMQDFKPMELATTAWSYATLAIPHSPLLHAISAAALRTISAFEPLNLANTAWACAKLQWVDEPLFEAIAGAAIPRIAEFEVKNLSNMVWAFATLELANEPLMKAMAGRSMALCGAQAFYPQALANTSWSMARLQFADVPLLEALASAAIATMAEFAPLALSSTSWAFATLAVRDGPLLEAISARAIRIIDEFNAQSLSNTSWAFATLACCDAPLFAAIAGSAIPQISEFTLQGLGNMVWAGARMGVEDRQLLDAIADAAIGLLVALPPATGDRARTWGQEWGGRALACLGVVESLAAAGWLEDVAQPARASLLSAAAAAFARGGAALDAYAGPRAVAPGGLRGDLAEETADGEPPQVLAAHADFRVLYKPPGWSVSVRDEGKERGGGASGETLDEADDEGGEGGSGRGLPLQRWVQGELGAAHRVAEDSGACHGLVHRLDRDTSGVLLCATSYTAFALARLQFAARRVVKEYLSLCHGLLHPVPRMIDRPLLKTGPPRARRSVIAVEGRQARTEVLAVAHCCHTGGATSPADAAVTFVSLRLHTGRLHQIRAHLAGEGCPVAGDPIYGGALAQQDGAWCPRLFLHSHRLLMGGLATEGGELIEGAEPLEALSALPPDLCRVLCKLRPTDATSRRLLAVALGRP